MYLAIARKYRPSQLSELVGQEHVVQTLKNAILLDRVSHAYLFCGARGVGKTSVARIFAKALRCPNVVEGTPCDKCTECLSISESRSVDVVEIDGASNNGVEAVRGIRENVAYGASSGRYKVYIIDEVHMLSLSAFNALLKTLEEPPAHVIFIFATTEVQKIPLTILSRCQRFDFRRLSQSQITLRLSEILSKEGFSLSEEALRTMASHSDGSLRDALSLLDQVLSYYGAEGQKSTPLSEKQVVEALGVNESSTVREFLTKILQKDLSGIIKVAGDTYFSGVDLKHFAEQCLEELRLLYLAALAKDSGSPVNAEILDVSPAHFTEVESLVKDIPLIQLERMAQIFDKTIGQLAWSAVPRLVLEMAAVRMAKLDALSQVEAALSSGRSLSSTPEPLPEIAGATESKPVPSPEISPPVGPPPEYLKETPPLNLERNREAGKAPAPVRPAGDSSVDGWRSFVEFVMKKRPLLGALLSHANFRMEMNQSAKKIHMAFPPDSFYEKQANETRNRNDILEMVKVFFGPEATLSLSADVAQTTISLEENRRLEIDATKKRSVDHPAVLDAKEHLGAEIVDINVEL